MSAVLDYLPFVGVGLSALSILMIAWVAVIMLRALRGARAWITPDAEGAIPIGGIIEGIARTAVQSRQTSDAAAASAEARRLTADQADFIQARLTEEHPEIAAGASMVFGKNWARTLAKNPEWLAAALKLGPKILGGLGGAEGVKSITDLAAQFGAVSQNVSPNGQSPDLSDLIPRR